jgi:hypothetical protein
MDAGCAVERAVGSMGGRWGNARIASSGMGLAILHWHLALSDTALVGEGSEAANRQHRGSGAGHDKLRVTEGAGHLHSASSVNNQD